MRSRARTFLLLASFSGALLLAGCDSFDPTDMFDLDAVFGTKKRLPGDRKPVFPEGTPGVPQGVPLELIRGNQSQTQPETTQSVPQQAAVQQATEAKPEAKPNKAKPKTAAKPKPVDKPAEPAESATAAAKPPARPAEPQSVQWPDPPRAQQSQSAGASGVVWPEPPTYSDRTRPQ
jgi:outer membrane biosynthesis protein TonB